jgi:hypothetical protein
VIVSTSLFRFNVIDDAGAVSFLGPAHGLKAIAAACSKGPRSIADLLDHAHRYDAEWIDNVVLGLLVFDEHNIDALSPGYEPNVRKETDRDHRAFRIVDAATRSRSMKPAQLGLVVVNLRERRIIQIHNSYAELLRKGRGRIRRFGVPTRSMFHYELPTTWSIVP